MAFHAHLGLPNIAAVTSDLWPSVSNVLSAPWGGRQAAVSGSRAYHASSVGNPEQTARKDTPRSAPVTLPDGLGVDMLRAATEQNLALRHQSSPLAVLLQGSRAASFSSQLSRIATTRRHHSTLSFAQFNRPSPIPKPTGLSPLQCQRYLFGGSSQDVLARMERSANNNPGSAAAQNSFYNALLKANMPGIIIERYRSGKFASNSLSEAVYTKALQNVGGGGDPAVAHGQQQHFNPANPNLSSDQLQAIGQAVAARSHGGQIGISNKNSGTGAKDTPLYVVVDESLGSSIFRWVRFFLFFGFITYFSLLLVTVFVETTGIMKNVRGSQTNEAKPEHQTVRFSDVHGCDEAKDELQELVEFLSNPDRFSSLGGKLPKGILLVGPPGTGKTLLARAVAGEAGVPFFYMSGSEFDEIYVGVGAKRVRELFTQARAKAPAIIFIDELDAIGAKRNERDAAYVKQTLNQLLTELDGFSQTSGVIIIAATNFPELLDKALTRPGRFDRKVNVNLPDVRGRVDILNHHMKNIQVSTEVDATVIARGTPGFSGADLENLINQAAIRASRDKKAKVGPEDFDYAKDKILMGAEARNRMLRDEDKLKTAYHEAGHALVAYFSPDAMPLYKITIVPRGMSLGTTHFLPEMDIVSKDYTEYISDIDVSMGGRAAEELIYGPDRVSSGISGDIRSATQTAFTLVTQYGYSKKLGNVDLNTGYNKLSASTKQEIENEVRRLVDEASARASAILKEHRHELELLTKALIEYETLTKEEMEKVLKGEKLDKLLLPSKTPIKLPEALTTVHINPVTGSTSTSK
ncbi:cell division protease ftsH [Nannizzia gypsea CBS 118893]|uniref:Cell division protease ftsH n=1 Tax=Arthroderma gypseum (strain ATCC MYA-4604 / CBS 118893) TaxID=535722 RepID=E4V167_ARTGP|nr:cell division protease ftsH [Nannizzia gypsea CBS 118893]EFR03782.1 cell division protease ftsH [Nannizzia gypsea CBS 118893]